MVTVETEDGKITLGVAEGFSPRLSITISDKKGEPKSETRLTAQQIEMFFSGLYVLRANVFRKGGKGAKHQQ